MPRFDLDNYVPVSERIEQFYEKYPDGRIETRLINLNNSADAKQTQFIVQAFIYDGERLLATGLAEESYAPSGANQTSPLENAETSSIGRAISNANISATRGQQRPSREEMAKVNRVAEAPVLSPDAIVLRGLLADKFPNSDDRLVWIEANIGRKPKNYGDLSADELIELLNKLGTKVVSPNKITKEVK